MRGESFFSYVVADLFLSLALSLSYSLSSLFVSLPPSLPHQVTAVVLSDSIARAESPDKPVSALVVATGVVKDSTFAVPSDGLSTNGESLFFFFEIGFS